MLLWCGVLQYSKAADMVGVVVLPAVCAEYYFLQLVAVWFFMIGQANRQTRISIGGPKTSGTVQIRNSLRENYTQDEIQLLC